MVYLISQSPELHAYAVSQLFKSMREDMTQQPLVQVSDSAIFLLSLSFEKFYSYLPTEGYDFCLSFDPHWLQEASRIYNSFSSSKSSGNLS